MLTNKNRGVRAGIELLKPRSWGVPTPQLHTYLHHPPATAGGLSVTSKHLRIAPDLPPQLTVGTHENKLISIHFSNVFDPPEYPARSKVIAPILEG
jgi:hypothetical protein